MFEPVGLGDSIEEIERLLKLGMVPKLGVRLSPPLFIVELKFYKFLSAKNLCSQNVKLLNTLNKQSKILFYLLNSFFYKFREY